MRSCQIRARESFRAALCALCVSILVSGCAVIGKTSAVERYVPKEPYPVVYADPAPVIDGVLDDPVWKKAVPMETFFEYKKTGVRVDIVRAWMAWDEKNLYLAASIRDKDIWVTETERDAVLCRADVVELFVKPPVRDRYEYELYEFEFNVWNAIWDIHYVGFGGGGDVRFSKGYEPDIVCRATARGTVNDWTDVDEGYTVEVSIPLDAFSRTVPEGPKAGDTWRYNVSGYDFSVYRREPLLWTSVDGNTRGFAEYELYPSMIFLSRE